MDAGEIAGVLRLANGTPDRRAVAAVADHTEGWACGVRRAAVTVATTRDLSAAMEETDRAIEDYLAHEVLAAMTAPVRRLLVWTSVVEIVAPGVVRAVLGPDTRRAIDRTMAATGLVQRFPDGSISCHPLLRAAARSQLSAEPTHDARAAHERVVRWFADHGELDAAVELGLAAQDWAVAASILVEAHAVPRIVAGTASELVGRAVALPQVQGVEPLLQTAFALARDDLIAAEVTFGSRVSRREPVSSGPADRHRVPPPRDRAALWSPTRRRRSGARVPAGCWPRHQSAIPASAISLSSWMPSPEPSRCRRAISTRQSSP